MKYLIGLLLIAMIAISGCTKPENLEGVGVEGAIIEAPDRNGEFFELDEYEETLKYPKTTSITPVTSTIFSFNQIDFSDEFGERISIPLIFFTNSFNPYMQVSGTLYFIETDTTTSQIRVLDEYEENVVATTSYSSNNISEKILNLNGGDTNYSIAFNYIVRSKGAGSIFLLSSQEFKMQNSKKMIFTGSSANDKSYSYTYPANVSGFRTAAESYFTFSDTSGEKVTVIIDNITNTPKTQDGKIIVLVNDSPVILNENRTSLTRNIDVLSLSSTLTIFQNG